jgi:hypothetical protein
MCGALELELRHARLLWPESSANAARRTAASYVVPQGANLICYIASAFICYGHFKAHYEDILLINSEEVRTEEEAEPSSWMNLTQER